MRFVRDFFPRHPPRHQTRQDYGALTYIISPRRYSTTSRQAWPTIKSSHDSERNPPVRNPIGQSVMASSWHDTQRSQPLRVCIAHRRVYLATLSPWPFSGSRQSSEWRIASNWQTHGIIAFCFFYCQSGMTAWHPFPRYLSRAFGQD